MPATTHSGRPRHPQNLIGRRIEKCPGDAATHQCLHEGLRRNQYSTDVGTITYLFMSAGTPNPHAHVEVGGVSSRRHRHRYAYFISLMASTVLDRRGMAAPRPK